MPAGSETGRGAKWEELMIDGIGPHCLSMTIGVPFRFENSGNGTGNLYETGKRATSGWLTVRPGLRL
jgi:hypothetical protein